MCGEPNGKQEWATETDFGKLPLPRRGRRYAGRKALRMGVGEGLYPQPQIRASARAARRRRAMNLMLPCIRVGKPLNIWSS